MQKSHSYPLAPSEVQADGRAGSRALSVKPDMFRGFARGIVFYWWVEDKTIADSFYMCADANEPFIKKRRVRSGSK